jgi:ADP-heptose:LPS heptosyltransferase
MNARTPLDALADRPADGLALPDTIERIAVFRALALGDMLCAVPALRAIRSRWPKAHLTLIGLPWAHELAARLPMVDDFLAFPGYPGLPERIATSDEIADFLVAARASRFDLVVQLHGSGRIVNPLVAALGAPWTAGFHPIDDAPPDPTAYTPWPSSGHEIERLLQLPRALGAPDVRTTLAWPGRPEDAQALAELVPDLDERPFVIVHPGSRLRSRRWPPERFAAVAHGLAEEGLRIIVTGGPDERAVADRVLAALRSNPDAARSPRPGPVLDLVGRTTLWTLGALVRRARLVLANDTGISHVAAAVGTPSVIVSSGAEVARWAPLDRERHQVLWHRTPCRPCAHEACPWNDHPCATGVAAAQVLAAARRTLAKREGTHAG